MRFDDHFTLQRPSSSVTFQRESVHIYELRDSQVQMKVSVQPDHNTIAENKEGMVWVHPPNNNDKDGNNDDGHKCDEAGDDFPYNFPPVKIEIKNVYHDRSEHISALRLTYTIVALFCMATVSFDVGICFVVKINRERKVSTNCYRLVPNCAPRKSNFFTAPLH